MQEQKLSSQKIASQFKIIAALVAVLWILEIIDWISGGMLDGLGIRPRSTQGLNGILFAPWLHFGFGHLMANTVPFAFLSWFVMVQGLRRYISVTIITILVGGLGVWLVAPKGSIHAGASILIFGYFGYLLLNGLIERSLASMSLMLIVITLYGSMIWGVLPGIPGVSWQGHLFGFIGGGLASWLLSSRTEFRDTPEEVGV